MKFLKYHSAFFILLFFPSLVLAVDSSKAGNRLNIASAEEGFFTGQEVCFPADSLNDRRIQPYRENPYYWQYHGRPVLLVGGSKEDNLFQLPDLEEHLDLLISVGGNYIRNTMSDRDQGNVKAFKQLPNGKFDLSQWNTVYWQRFETMLKLTSEREIIVQIELWDQWDMGGRLWNRNPWNPDLNINYATKNTYLKGNNQYNGINHQGGGQLDFFLTVPEVHNDTLALKYQQKFVDKVLSYTLKYDNVLYTITNELFLQHSAEWSWYWGKYIRQKASEAGMGVEVTEMLQVENIRHEQHKISLDHSDIFTFTEVSQNSGRHSWVDETFQGDQKNWDNFQWVRKYIKDNIRPINSVKIYPPEEYAIPTFWRTALGGGAAVRFHRDGLKSTHQRSLEAMAKIQTLVTMWELEPSQHLLSNRENNEAFLAAKPGEQYVLFFPKGGEISLNMNDYNNKFTLQWISIDTGEWGKSIEIDGGEVTKITAPSGGLWAAAITIKQG